MPAGEISSPHNPLIKEYIALSRSGRQRRLVGKLALEGPHLVWEALRAGLVPEVLLYTRRYREQGGALWERNLPPGTRQYAVSEALFARLARTETPQEVAAIVPLPRAVLPENPSLVLVLDRIQDPGNMGTLVRTAAAAGVEAVYCAAGCVDPFSPKVLRSSAGAAFFLPLAGTVNPLAVLAGFRRQGGQVVITAPAATASFWEADYCRPTAVVIGNESSGISPEICAAADFAVSIPQPGWDRSLNAAVSAAVILYEILRQRRR